jgi:nicotinate-nucleotide adenylyltransferase
MTKLIGILGGTFDPIHFGHLRPALDVMQATGLDQIRFLPNKTPPHRQQPWLDSNTRRQLVELAIAGTPEFLIDERELSRQGPSYMVDTLKELKAQFPDDSLCLIMGMDAFTGFVQWHQWQKIFELCHLIITSRPGQLMPNEGIPDFAEHQAMIQNRVSYDPKVLRQSQHGQILLQSVTLLDISATQIRQSLSSGKSIHYLLPDNVRKILEDKYAI